MRTLINILRLFIFLAFILTITQSCKKNDSESSDLLVVLLEEDEELPYQNTHWMKMIDDDKSLSEITIPGTHDAGADQHTSQVSPLLDDVVICQDFTLENQLKLGVRWIDVRLRLKDGVLTLHHGDFYLNKNFNDFLDVAINFLTDHPHEAVIFMIKQEKSDESDHDFAMAVHNYLHERSVSDNEHFYLERFIPLMREARGNIVFVRRFENDTEYPLGMHMNWDDNTTGSWYYDETCEYYVQDHYSLNTVSDQQKADEINVCIKKAHEGPDPAKIYMNFTSGERVAYSENLWATAKGINPLVVDYLNDHLDWYNCGVIMVNFAGGSDQKDSNGNRTASPELVQKIIDHNFLGVKEIVIGNQVWTLENLNTAYFNNGDPVREAYSQYDFDTATSGVYMYYDGIYHYGKLYNWYAVHDSRDLAPEGYHVATAEDWNILEEYLGGADIAGGKIKSVNHWLQPNVGALNESGFSALPSGYNWNGLFYGLNAESIWWTATNVEPDSAVMKWVKYDATSITTLTEDISLNLGLPVRCVKD